MGDAIMFDFRSLAQEYGISSEVLDQLLKEAREEFPADEMMVELHVLRALKALRRREAGQGWLGEWNH